MLFNTLISFLLLALAPFFVFAESESSTTTTVATTITSTATSYVTMTGYPPSSTSVSFTTSSTLASFLNSTTTLTSTFETSISKTTGSPSNYVNGTIGTPTPIALPLPGAAAGSFRVSYSLGAAVLGAVLFGML